MEDWVAMLIGAIVIVLFSFERFNRANYEQKYQLDELMRLLAPDQLRARSVVTQAYVGYTVLLLLIYFLVCAFSNVFVLLGFDALAGKNDIGGGASTVGSNADEAETLGIRPEVSLTVALIMVGLAPSVPVLKRFEEIVRYWAHRLAGIPTHVLNILSILRHRQISLPENHDYKKDSLLIDLNDWRRMSCSKKLLAQGDMGSQSFERDLLVMFAASSWILDNQIQMHRPSDRQRFLQLEDKLRSRKKELVGDLDDLINLYIEGDQTMVATDQNQIEMQQTSPEDFVLRNGRSQKWERLFARADDLAEGFCTLIALYVERGIIQNTQQDTIAENSRTKAQWVKQYAEATRLLNDLTKDTVEQSVARNANTRDATTLFMWMSTTIVVTTAVWSLFVGRYSYELRHSHFAENWYEPVWFQFVEAIFSFCLPMGIALTVYALLRNRDRWENTVTASASKALAQYFAVVAVSWLITMVIVLGVFIWLTALNWGWDVAINNVGFVVEYEAVAKFRGVGLSVLLIYLCDVAQDREASKEWLTRSSMPKRWIAIGALLVGAIGFWGRYAQSLISVRESASRSTMDAIDGGLIVYATLYSALIGLVALYIFGLVIRDRAFVPSPQGSKKDKEAT
ncbi:hypothetical protein [uncultured Roseobacter sp.]|uniref:hypothetical protein n=1 Tax=uncultured Roseobacter sp. TaxID=114847 RepID=UPI002620DBB2|nr:hypothetical protein [uncultured Roseobacter sp.]